MKMLKDARKLDINIKGVALLQWGFNERGHAAHSVEMPEDVIDNILDVRDFLRQNAYIVQGYEKDTGTINLMGKRVIELISEEFIKNKNQ